MPPGAQHVPDYLACGRDGNQRQLGQPRRVGAQLVNQSGFQRGLARWLAGTGECGGGDGVDDAGVTRGLAPDQHRFTMACGRRGAQLDFVLIPAPTDR